MHDTTPVSGLALGWKCPTSARPPSPTVRQLMAGIVRDRGWFWQVYFMASGSISMPTNTSATGYSEHLMQIESKPLSFEILYEHRLD